MKRPPFAAGTFYDFDEEDLIKRLEWAFKEEKIGPGQLPNRNVEDHLTKNVGIIVPHAGYVYSGPVAAWAYLELSKLGKPDTVVLIGPNHTGIGGEIGVWPSDIWVTPLGNIEVDEEVTTFLIENSNVATSDTVSHLEEHSLEVQLPFLQYIYGNDFKIVPITMMIQEFEFSRLLAKDLKNVLEKFSKRRFVIVASSDLNHYESQDVTLEKDEELIKAILSNDPKEVYTVVKNKNVTACGFGAITTLLQLKIGKPLLLKHATSGDTSGDLKHVVGYSSFIVA